MNSQIISTKSRRNQNLNKGKILIQSYDTSQMSKFSGSQKKMESEVRKSVIELNDHVKRIPRHKLKMVFSKKTKELNKMLGSKTDKKNLHLYESSNLSEYSPEIQDRQNSD